MPNSFAFLSFAPAPVPAIRKSVLDEIELDTLAPSISAREGQLTAGQVVTVEPGLYYYDIGGVRIEDVVWVTADGCTMLTDFPKFLEL